MSTSVGSLSIDMVMNILRIQKDTEAARNIVEKGMKGIEGAVSGAVKVLGFLGVGLSAAAFSSWIRGAIDAADEASKMSQKLGIMTSEVAGLNLAFQQSGLDSATMQGSIAKLSKSIADGNIGLKALGVRTHEVGGGFRSTKEVLYEVADKFAQMPPGIQRTAMAMEIFGKSGANMIPLLVGGSAGLKEMADMAEKLGLVVSEQTGKEAEAFNDTMELLGLGARGVATQLSAKLLPTLVSLASSFLESMTDGDKLKRIADALGTGLKVLYTVVVGVVGGFTALGTAWGAIFAAIAAATRGDFSQAVDIVKTGFNEVKSSLAGTAATIARAWTEEGNAAVAGVAKTLGAGKDLLAQAKAREEAAKVAAAAAKKQAEAFDDLVDKLNGKANGVDKDFLATMKMIIAEGQKRKMAMADIVKIQEMYLKQQPFMLEAEKAELAYVKAIAEERQRLKNLDYDQSTSALREITESYTNAVKSVRDRVDAMKDENAALVLSRSMNVSLAEAIEMVAIARLEERRERIHEGTEAHTALTEEIRLRRELMGMLKDNAAAQEHLKMWESIDKTAHDTFVNIFDSGSNAFKKLGQTLKSAVLDLLYQMTIKKWILNVATSSDGGGGGGGVAGQAVSGIASGAMNALGMAGGVGGMISSVGTAFTAGSTSVGVMAGSVAGGGGLMGGIAAGLSAIPVVGWIALAAMALYSIFGGKGGGPKTEGGYAPGGMSIAGRDIGGNQQGSVRGDVASAQKISEAISQGYAGIASQFGVKSALPVGVFFAQDNAEGGDSLTQLQITSANYNRSEREGGIENVARGKEGFEAAIAESTADLYLVELQKSVEGRIGDFFRQLDPAALDSKQISAEIQKAANAQMVWTAFKDLGVAFQDFTVRSVGATTAFIELAGGIEALTANVDSYYENYYTAEEKRTLTAERIAKMLNEAGVGFDAGTILAQANSADPRAWFRSVVEEFAAMGPAGDIGVAAMLKVNAAFASIAEPAETFETVVDGVVTTMSDALSRLLSERQNLQVELLRAQGNTSGANAMQRMLDTAGFTAAEIAAYDFNAALRETINALNTAAERARAIETERYGLETQLLQLQGDTTALRERELARLDPTNQAIQLRIWALQDEKAAAEAATGAIQDQVKQTEVLIDYEGNVNSARSALMAEYQRERAELEATSAKYRQFARSLKDARDAMWTGKGSTLTPAARTAEALRIYQQTAGRAMAGDADSIASLQSAGNAYLEALRDSSPTKAEFNVGFSTVAAGLTLTAVKSDTLADRADAQISRLDAQVSALGLLQSTTQQGFAALLAAYLGALAAQASATPSGDAGGAAGGSASPTPAPTPVSRPVVGTLESIIEGWYAKHPDAYKNPPDADVDWWEARVREVGIVQAKLDFANSVAQITGKPVLSVSRFRNGGMFGGGARIVGDGGDGSGAELEVTGPARYYGASETKDLLAGGGGKTASAVKELQADQRIQAAAQQEVLLRFTKLLERWETDGMPETRETA